MPRLDDIIDGMEQHTSTGAGNFQFSAIRPDKLTAVEYTLASIVVDTSSSVHSFAAELLATLRTAAESCKKSPRANNLLLRAVTFDSSNGVQEIHGFKPLSDIDPATQYTD